MEKRVRVRIVLGSVLFAIVAISAPGRLSGQWIPGFLANESYWGGGKAEFDIYEAQLMRTGQLRKCEFLHILVRDRLDPKTLAQVDDPKRGDVILTIRMNQIWSAPIGLSAEHGAVVAYWQADAASLLRLMFVGTDSIGDVMQKIELKAGALTYSGETYHQGVLSNPASPPSNAIFYDELPVRVRTIDWSSTQREFTMPLGPSLATFKTTKLEFTPATVSWRTAEKSLEVVVKRGGEIDRFLLDHDFPFLLREWQMSDGSRLKLKRSLRVDYWNYGKEGDRERALNNPMLQHPD